MTEYVIGSWQNSNCWRWGSVLNRAHWEDGIWIKTWRRWGGEQMNILAEHSRKKKYQVFKTLGRKCLVCLKSHKEATVVRGAWAMRRRLRDEVREEGAKLLRSYRAKQVRVRALIFILGDIRNHWKILSRETWSDLDFNWRMIYYLLLHNKLSPNLAA